MRRRDFLIRSATTAGAAWLSSKSILNALAEQTLGQKFSASDTVTLGSTGIKTSRLAMGTGTIGSGHHSHQTALGIKGLSDLLLNGAKVYVLAVIEHGTRRIRIRGATGHPVQPWVVQQARNLLMDLEDAGTRAKFVLHDRDASFTATFDSVFQAAGIRVIRSAGPGAADEFGHGTLDRQLPA